jgi:alcohol dehydrogenase
MKALTFHGPGKITLDEKPRPTLLEPTDAIVKISKTTICGTDLHIIRRRPRSPTAGAGA